MKKFLSLLMVAVLSMSLFACGNPAPQTTESSIESQNADENVAEQTQTSSKVKVGVSMPTKSLQRWNQDGSNMKAALETAGYEVDLQYAGDNDISMQVSQLENMITNGVQVLVIASIDGSALGTPLEQAKAKGIPVVAYDRLIMNSDAVSYYATFDNEKVGTIQGQFIEEKLDLKNTDGPYNIELFTGAPDDNNVNYFFGGAMAVLQPYIDDGKLKVLSGQTSKAQCATANWSTEESQKRMENLITSQGYGPNGTKLDAVLSSNDSVANGITNALTAVGYDESNFPILTGQDCDKPSVKNMMKGLQSMSVFKDTRTLADQVVKMVTQIVENQTVDVNDTQSYDNGTGIIPTFLCDPVFCTKDNVKELLVDSGYYTASEIE